MVVRLAATVMIVRDVSTEPDQQSSIEVFMVRRVVQSEFMPDVYVFPGGSVSADASAVEHSEGLCVPVASSDADPEGRTALGNGIRAAAIRELFEEANVLLAYQQGELLAIHGAAVNRFTAYRQAFNQRQGSLVEMAHNEHLTFATDRLAYFAHWITPEGTPKRFDTHFFLATAPVAQEALFDQLETSEGIWIRPGDALQRFEQHSFPLAFPTFHQLRDLAVFANVHEALTAATTRYVPTRQPIVTQKDGKPHVYLSEDPLNVWAIR